MPEGSGGVTITNSGGTIYCKPINWDESQICEVAIREVPTRSAGPKVDVGTYILKNRKLRTTIRASAAVKGELQSIFDADANCTITAQCESGSSYPRWTYTCWFVNKRITWRYIKESATEVYWLTDLEFVCSTFAYELS